MESSKRSLWRNIAIAALGVVCGMGAILGYRAVSADFKMAEAAFSSASASSTVSVSSAFADSIGAPSELVIPKINVDAPVTDVGIAADGDLGVPNDAVHVAWYKNGPRPGEQGAAVIDGHLDTIHAPEAVFYNLGELAPGDEIEVLTASGQTLTFKVTKTAAITYDASTSDIFATTSNVPHLNLITCAGDWMPSKKLYNERLVVFSELVSVSPQ